MVKLGKNQDFKQIMKALNQNQARIDELKKIKEEAKFMKVLLGNVHIGTQGAKPNSRKFQGCTFLKQRFFFFGGIAMELLNEMRSFSLGSSWQIEHQVSQKDEPQDRESKQFPSADYIYKRFSFSMDSFLDRFIVVFGGAGSYIERIQKRETFNDIQVWDTEIKQWIDMRLESLEKDNFKKLATVEPFKESDYHFETKPAPTQRCQHGGCIYGGCLVIYGGLYGEGNQILGDTAMFDFSLG